MVSAEVIVFPDAEQVLVDFLTAELHARAGTTTIPVGTAVPDPRPDRFITVLRTGGPARSMVVDSPAMTVEAWSDDEDDAITLANLCRGVILAAGRAGQMGTTSVYDDIAEFSAPQNLPDPRTGQYRYTFTHEIPMRGRPA